jgi:hypothetical protein
MGGRVAVRNSQSRTARADVDECYLLVSRVHSHGTVVNPAGDAVLTAPIVKEDRSEPCRR